MVRVSIDKNLVGSALAGAIGGSNSQTANVVAAAFIATGQDAAHVVSSSQCLTLLEPFDEFLGTGSESEPALYVSCTMPCLEVGTVGGGTGLPAQSAALSLLGLDQNQNSDEETGAEATSSARLARVVCATVLAAELSLIAALSKGHLVGAHSRLNRARTTHVSLAASAANGGIVQPAFQT